MSNWATVLIFILGAIVFVCIGLLAAQFIRPNKPNAEKLSTYESGEQTLGNAWGKMSVRYLAIALLFLLFEIEMVFLFPWATVYAHPELMQKSNRAWAYLSLSEMFIFVFILTLGLAYAWQKGFLDWTVSSQVATDFKSEVPTDLYQNINKKYS